MRNIIISLAAAASALAVASPAAAQWGAPQPNYGQSYYGRANYGQVRALQARVDNVRNMIQRFDRSNRISQREARRLDAHAVDLHRRIHHAAQRGLHYRERQEVEYRVQALREAVRYAARDNRRWGWNGQNGHNAYANNYGYYGERLRDDDRRGGRDNDWRDDDRRGDRHDDRDDDYREGRRDRD